MKESHKGKPCKYKNIYCQEGICKECWIYIQWDKILKECQEK